MQSSENSFVLRYERLLLLAALISRNAFSHIGLDIVVIVHVVGTMAPIRSKQLGSEFVNILGHRINFGICYDCAAGEVDLCVCTYIPD